MTREQQRDAQQAEQARRQATTLGALSQRHGSPRSVAAIFLTGTVMMLPALYGQNLQWLNRPGLALGAVYAGVATLALAYALFAHGVSTLGSATAVTISLLEPLTAALLGVFALGEPLTAAMVAGFVLILAGLVVAVHGHRTNAAGGRPTCVPPDNLLYS